MGCGCSLKDVLWIIAPEDMSRCNSLCMCMTWSVNNTKGDLVLKILALKIIFTQCMVELLIS